MAEKKQQQADLQQTNKRKEIAALVDNENDLYFTKLLIFMWFYYPLIYCKCTVNPFLSYYGSQCYEDNRKANIVNLLETNQIFLCQFLNNSVSTEQKIHHMWNKSNFHTNIEAQS